MADDVRKIVHSFFAERGKSVSSDSTDVFEAGIIDSMELMELLLHMEERHGISIDQEWMSVDNFRSIDAITETIQKFSR